MQVEQPGLAGRWTSLRIPLRDTPHLTIETNRTCNLRCRSCYTLDKERVKTPDEVKEEISLGLKKRNIETISLLGGEPTLYPQLTEIIRFIKSKGLKCQLLTNGQRFMEEKGGRLLMQMTAAGLDRILLHVDSGQVQERGDIETVRRRLFAMMERTRLHFLLSLTVYEGEVGYLPKLLKRYADYRYFDGILAILHRDPADPSLEQPEMGDVHQSLKIELGLEPAVFIPTNLDGGSVGWLVYLYYLDSRAGDAFGLSAASYRGYAFLHRLIRGRRPFSMLQRPRLQPWLFLLSALIESMIKPKKLYLLYQFLIRRPVGSILNSVRFHYVIIQNPPHFNVEKNCHEFCYGCPDATIRNGKLTPVCVADLINPFPGQPFCSVNSGLFQEVFAHLGEA